MSFKGIKTDGIVEIGYGINSEFEGQGLMTEAVTAVVKWASIQKGVKQIEAETDENNIASKRVLEKSGFVLFWSFFYLLIVQILFFERNVI